MCRVRQALAKRYVLRAQKFRSNRSTAESFVADLVSLRARKTYRRSLKIRPATRKRFPRMIIRGLIEGWLLWWLRVNCWTFPRMIIRGLIEGARYESQLRRRRRF